MYLGKSKDELKKLQAYHTAKEISQQGEIWEKLAKILDSLDMDLLKELKDITQNREAQIIFCGAGSSAYIGNILASSLNPHYQADLKSIPTTDILSQPKAYFQEESRGIVISFGRSGNSPESLSIVEKIKQIAPHMRHIFITCNEEGALAKQAIDDRKSHLCLMPKETHDVSFVMTSSFSSMLLFAYGLFQKIDGKMIDFSPLSLQSNEIRDNFYKNKLFDSIDSIERIVYLGSNHLYGAAQESALKILEMTMGRITAMAETSLGFRHGPKSIINDKTMICAFVSNDPYTQLYDKDMILELIKENHAAKIVIFGSQEFFQTYDFSHHQAIIVPFHTSLNSYDDALLAALFVYYAQVIGFEFSIQHGFSPDNPCPTDELNRVVQNVNIYKHTDF